MEGSWIQGLGLKGAGRIHLSEGMDTSIAGGKGDGGSIPGDGSLVGRHLHTCLDISPFGERKERVIGVMKGWSWKGLGNACL